MDSYDGDLKQIEGEIWTGANNNSDSDSDHKNPRVSQNGLPGMWNLGVYGMGNYRTAPLIQSVFYRYF